MTVTPCTDTGATTHQLRIIGPAPDFARYSIVGCPAPYTLSQGSTVRAVGRNRVTSRSVGATIPGETVTNVRARPRDIAVPVVIHGETEADLENAINSLDGFLNSIEGPSRIVWTRAAGNEREITAHYLTGAETIRIVDLDNHRHVEAQLVFRAHFPYWRDFAGEHIGSVGTFLDSAGAGITHTTLTNDGTIRTWPQIIIDGPCENIELANVATGQVLRVTEILAVGQTVRIQTDPRFRAVYLDDVWQPSVLDPSRADMWPLLPGDNPIVLSARSPGDAGAWQISWQRLYDSP